MKLIYDITSLDSLEKCFLVGFKTSDRFTAAVLHADGVATTKEQLDAFFKDEKRTTYVFVLKPVQISCSDRPESPTLNSIAMIAVYSRLWSGTSVFDPDAVNELNDSWEQLYLVKSDFKSGDITVAGLFGEDDQEHFNRLLLEYFNKSLLSGIKPEGFVQ